MAQIKNASSYNIPRLVGVEVAWNPSHLPCQERFLFNDGRLLNLLTWEHAPRHSISPVLGNVTPAFSLQNWSTKDKQKIDIYSYAIVGHEIMHPTAASLVDSLLKRIDILDIAEKLDKAFLEDVSQTWSPTINLVTGTNGVHRRLRSNCPPSSFG